MEEKKQETIDQENNKTTKYKAVKMAKTNSLWKTILVPFCSGILGATLVIGGCFGIPAIRNQLIGGNSKASSTNDLTYANQTNNIDLVSLSNYSDTAVGVAKKVLPSIVGIKVEYTVNSAFGKGMGMASAEGSGIIMSKDGYILTNNHVVNTSDASSYYEVSQASKIIVYLYNDQTEYTASIVGTDSQSDLAVIKIEKNDLTPATIGNSDNVRVGEFSMAIGNPLGMQSSVTSGIISAINRQVTDSEGKTFTLLQTDAAINSGNSGGALVNSNGEVIGINTLKLNGTGIEGMGFAIPINATTTIYDQLVKEGKVKRPYLGITGINLDSQTAKANNLVEGIYVKAVESFSSAEKSGIQAGDVIIAADGKKIKTMEELNEIKNSHQIGDQMTLKINRNGTEKECKLILQEQS